MPYDYMGQSGEYHMFRDSATGEEYPVGQEDADYLMSQQASAPEPAAPPMPTPGPMPQRDPGFEPLAGVTGVPGQEQAAAPQPMQRLQGLPQEYGGAPPAPEPRRNRIPLGGSGGQQEPSGPRMRAPGVIDNGDGTISQYRAGSKGGWTPVSRRGGGTDPALLGDLANKAGELRDQRIQNMFDAEAAQSENLMAEREAAAARRMQAQLERERSEAVIKKVETERDTKWKEFAVKQESIGKMSGAPASENWGTVILSALAAGLGAYGSAMTGTPNFALDILNNAKKQKIDQARYDVDKAKSDLGTEREEFDRYLSTSLDGKRLERQAAIEREQIEAMREIEADKELRGVHPQMAEVRAQAEQQYQQTLAALYSQWQVESTDRYAAPTAGGWKRGADPELKYQAEVGKLKSEARKGDIDPNTSPVFWGGKKLASVEKGVATELNEKALATKAVVRVLDKVVELQEKGSSLSADDRAMLKNLNARAVLTQAKALGLRVGSDNDWNKIEEAIGAGSFDTITRQGKVQASEMRQEAVRSLSDSFEHYGVPSEDIQGSFKNKSTRTDVSPEEE